VLILKNLAFTLVLPGTLGVYLPLWIAQGPPRASGALGILALALLALGAAIYAWCVWDFATFGGATPAPIDPPKRVVMRGLYRYTRNPMYVGVLSVILGIAALHRSIPALGYALVVATGFHLFVLLYEEPHLRSVFGAEYEDYCRRVGRWIPKRA
jgi:protein-S-isoprenylcysteine O-methyltransferase Ste14